MNQSESLANLAAALSAVQGALRPAEENATNPFFKSKYADLASIISAARTYMAANGLSVSQFPGPTYNGDSHHYATLTTILMHKSGEWISQDLTMPLAKVDPQGYGSAITYARRYALASVLGIVAGEDDDANAATVTISSTKKLTRNEFLDVIVEKLGYKGHPHVLATMKVIGFDKIVPEDSDERKRIFEALKEYRAYRDAGMSQDEALQAMADREVQDVE